MDINQLDLGVVSLAVPLMSARGKVMGSLCFVGPEFRFTEENIQQQLLTPLLNAGLAISAKLGYFGSFLGKQDIQPTREEI